MSRNKRTGQMDLDALTRSDHAAILSCLTDDIEWVVPGHFRLSGKAAFDGEIENDAFVGSPTISVTRLTEASDVVVAEGRVRSERRAGGFLDALFCAVCVMRAGEIRHLTSYLLEIAE